MRYNYDTYKLYLLRPGAKGSARIKVSMKETVRPEILQGAVNTAIKRYPYFAVRVSVDQRGGFILSPNDRPVAVVETSDHMPMLGSPPANGHLLFVDYRGRNIYFNISHSLAGARGYMPWVFTTVYEYVRECFGVEPHAPSINKPESPLLPGECEFPPKAFFSTKTPVPNAYQGHGGLILFEDMIRETFLPGNRSREYRTWQLEDGPVLAFAKDNGTTVAGAFLMLMARALDLVLADRFTPLCGGILHNPLSNWGFPNAHADVSTHVFLDYDRALIRGDAKAMGACTSGQIRKQTDPDYTKHLFRKHLELIERIDRAEGLIYKRRSASDAIRSILPAAAVTYVVSYGGFIDLGELKDYVDAYYNVIEGNMTLTVTAMEGKLFLSFIQNIREEKYVHALNEVFDRAGFLYRMEGPFRQRLASHEFCQ
ncbi:MAG: hypothetical protein K5696_02000 [Lachnospiraceae bacterium]|nr:hypothetical protein [Lachnospiraceae bacterium]